MSLINRNTNSSKVSSTVRRMARGYVQQMSGRVVRSPWNKSKYPTQWVVDYSEGGLFQSPLQVKVDYS